MVSLPANPENSRRVDEYTEFREQSGRGLALGHLRKHNAVSQVKGSFCPVSFSPDLGPARPAATSILQMRKLTPEALLFPWPQLLSSGRAQAEGHPQ